MSLHELAGKPVPREMLVNVPRLVSEYYTRRPDPENPAEGVSFGTSGHRGSSLKGSFNEAHVLAIVQAVCEHRAGARVAGPLFLGMDTHALSEPAFASALEVLAANGVETMIQAGRGYTPTPVVSHAILGYNRGRDGRPRRRDRHHALAQPPRGRRHQVRPAERRPGRHRGHARHRGAGERAAGRRPRRRAPDAVQPRPQGRDDARPRLRHAVCRRPGEHRRPRSDRARRPEDRRRPDGRRRHRLLGPDRHDVRPRARDRQPRGRPDVRLHAARPRREDPHGLLLPARDGGPDRAQGATSTSPSATTRTSTATASSRAAAA